MHLGSRQIGPEDNLAQDFLGSETAWTLTFWPKTFQPETFWSKKFWPKTFWPKTFWPTTFGLKTFRPKTFWPKIFRPLVNYIYSTMLYMSRVFIMNNRNNFASSIKCDWRQRSTSKALQEMHRSRDYSKVPTKVGDSGHFRFKPRISAQISHCSYCSP